MKRKLSLVRGDQYGNVRQSVTPDWQLDREMKDAFIGMHGEDGSVPSEAIYDIRRGRQAPWRFLARRIREARSTGVPKGQVQELVRVLSGYVESVYADATIPKRAA